MASRRSRVHAPALPETVEAAGKPEFTLDADASAHLVRVLRARPGDELALFDGRGSEYLGVVAESDAGACRVRLVERLRHAPPPARRLRLLQASIRTGLEGVLQQATELGVTDIAVFRARRSPPAAWRRERAERVVAGAAEQCGRLFLPALSYRETLAEALGLAGGGVRLIAVPGAGALAGTSLDADVAVAVGPEGGFAPEELDLAAAAGFEAVGFGALTLRAATAAPAVLAALRQRQGWREFGA